MLHIIKISFGNLLKRISKSSWKRKIFKIFINDVRSIRVSIVVPVYNKDKYLEKTIDSLINQTHDNLEIILVNDGSTDHSIDILERFEKSDVRISVINQKNMGLSAARNTGLAAAKGAFVLFFDADDILLDSAVEKLLKIALEDDADIVAGVHERITIRQKREPGGGENETVVRKRIKEQWRVWNRNINMREKPELMALYGPHISACNKLFKRDFLLKNKVMFVPGLYMQDLELWLRIVFISKRITFTPYIVTQYFARHDGAAQQRTLNRFRSLIQIYKLQNEFYKSNHLQAFEKYRDEAILYVAVFFFLRWFIEDIENPELASSRDELALLLQSMPEEHLESFFSEPIGPVLLAYRCKNYDKAVFLYQSPPASILNVLEETRKGRNGKMSASDINTAFNIVPAS